MFLITTVLMVAVCGVLIGVGFWWPPREQGLTVVTLQRRLAFESYCRQMGSQWPARTEADRDHELILSRFHAISAADSRRALARRSFHRSRIRE